MERIKFDYSGVMDEITLQDIENILPEIESAKKTLDLGTGPGKEFLGWLDLPEKITDDEISQMEEIAREIRANSEVFIVVGIGGSYLGTRAAIQALNSEFYNELALLGKVKSPAIYFAGCNMSSDYFSKLLDVVGNRKVTVNVVSKSGTTTEPAIAFRLLTEAFIKKFGVQEAKKRVIATTDRAKGALKTLADKEGYKTFVIEDDIGGRFSVLTPVGLLPMAVAGISIRDMINGAKEAMKMARQTDIRKNVPGMYAAVRNALYRKGKLIELFTCFEPGLHYVGEWWKQLMGESEGKEQRGIYPDSLDFSTDLHSMGQYIQQGMRILMETFIHIEASQKDIEMLYEQSDLDGLNYLHGKTLNFVNSVALEGTAAAHRAGGVPGMKFILPRMDAFYLGQLFYIFEYACGCSGYTLQVNPFDQPGVESYKKNMFALLGKPGFEKLRKELEQTKSDSGSYVV